MLGDNYDFLLFFQAPNCLGNLKSLLHIQVAGGLIEKVHICFAAERGGDGYTLKFASAEHV
jgi:hypothetical protein